MDKKYKIRTLLYLYITLGFTMYLFSDYDYSDNKYDVYETELEPFGSYQRGNIYIGNHEYINSIKNKIKINDILIEKGYKEDSNLDPNYKIYSSYSIENKNERNTILNVLKEYDRLNPWGFNRTI